MTIEMRFAGGWSASNAGPNIRVGDRLMPSAIDVRCNPADGQPTVTMRLELIDGVPQCREMSISSAPSGRAVRPKDLTTIALLELVEDFYAAFSWPIVEDSGDGVAMVTVPDKAERLRSLESFAAARRGKGARKITPILLERAAEVYRENVANRPIEAVAAEFAVSERSASGYITRARQAGYLPPTTRGKKAI